MKAVLIITCALLMTISCGCGGSKKPDGFPKIYPCDIVVTQENTPLVGANIILNPISDSMKRWSVGGTTDENGVAIIATYGKYVGAPEGEFIVTVHKEEIDQKTAQDSGAHEPRTIGTTKISFFVEDVYTKPETSPLRVNIQKGKSAHFELNAGKKTKITKNVAI